MPKTYQSTHPGFSIAVMLGAPRSGTTWLQRLMAAHDSVASGQETDLLDDYVGPWDDKWRRQLPQDPVEWKNRRHKGLPAILTASEFDDLLRSTILAVYAKIAALKPGAHVVLDKNPDYARRTAMIARLLPEARIIHVVRDGRDVAVSLVSAGRGWGRDWAPRHVDQAAKRWRGDVLAVQGARLGSDRCLEVRYEDLLTSGPEVLLRCLTFCGVAADLADCREIHHSFQLQRLQGTQEGDVGQLRQDPLVWSGEVVRRLGGPPSEPAGFFGKGESGGWRSSWAAPDRWAFAEVAGDLLISLGYEPDESWLNVSTRLRLLLQSQEAARNRLQRVRRGARSLARRGT